MKEDFVSYYIAVKLKEKGFNDECHAYYEPLKHCLNLSRVFKTNSLAENYNCIAAPTMSQVLKWLRKERGIFVEISPAYMDITFYVSVYKIKDGRYIRYRMLEFKYKSYEQAALAGIEYVIDNLI